MARKKPIPPLTREGWLERYHSGSDQATRWFYVGVGGFAILILVMWLIGISVQMGALSRRRSLEIDLVEKTKTSWDEIFAARDKKSAEQNIKQTLAQTLAAIKLSQALAAKNSTTTSSTSEETATTTSSTIK